jgi:hypothetical protein
MKEISLFIVLALIFSACQHQKSTPDSHCYVDTLYYSSGKIEMIMKYKDSLPDGRYEYYYPNGQMAEKGRYLRGKAVGEFYKYDSTGVLTVLQQRKLIYEEKPYMNWDPTLDSIDTENKISAVNTLVSFNKDGSIDGTRSFFFQYSGTDTISLGDSLSLEIYLAIPYFKEVKHDKFNYSFTIPDDEGMVLYRTSNAPYTKYKYKPKKRGTGKIFFVIDEYNPKTDSVFYYQESFPYFVR